MNLALDPPTLFAALAAAFAGAGIALAIVARGVRREPGLAHVWAGYGFVTLALVALRSQGHDASPVRLVAGNVLLVLGAALLLEGARGFAGLARERYWTMLATLVTGAVVALQAGSSGSESARIATTNAILALLLGRLAATTRSARPLGTSRAEAGFLALGPALLAAGFALRAALAASGLRPPDLARGDWATSAVLLLSLVVMLVWPLGLVSLAHQRLLAASAETERRLAASEQRYRGLLESTPDALVIVERDGRIAFVNTEAERLFGHARADLLGRTIEMLVPERMRDRHRGHRAAFVAGRSPRDAPVSRPMGALGQELVALRKDGTEIPVEVSLSPMASGESLLVSSAIRDVSDRIRDQEELRASEIRYRSLFEESLGYIVVLDPTGSIQAVNPAAARALGAVAEELVGRPLREFVERESRAGFAERLSGWRAGVADEDPFEIALRTASGEKRTWRMHARSLADRSGSLTFLVSAVDVSDRKQLEEELRSRALHDPLTGLANRSLFEDRLRLALAQARRNGEQGLAAAIGVVFVDLDDFKAVNDQQGHATGDALLVEIAARLRTGVRGVDTVARWGGDEFAVILAEIRGRAEAELVVAKLRERLRRPAVVGEHRIVISATLGLAVYPEDGDTARRLLERADAAMYSGKRR